MNESCTSTEKQSGTASEGYPILDVTVEKGKVLLTLKHDVLTLSQEVYAEGYYYPGKVLSKKECQHLKNEEKLSKAKSYLSLLLSRGRYSVKETKKRLKEKYRLNEKQIDSLLVPYLESHILSDQDYALDFIESRAEKGYGRRYFLSELKKRGIGEDILSSEEITSLLSDGKEALPLLVEKECKKRKNVSPSKREEQIICLLIRRGFALSDIRNAMDDYENGKSEEEKRQDAENCDLLLRKDVAKCYNAVMKKYSDPQKRKDEFFHRLLWNGYKYSKIEEIRKEEDYSFHD